MTFFSHFFLTHPKYVLAIPICPWRSSKFTCLNSILEKKYRWWSTLLEKNRGGRAPLRSAPPCFDRWSLIWSCTASTSTLNLPLILFTCIFIWLIRHRNRNGDSWDSEFAHPGWWPIQLGDSVSALNIRCPAAGTNRTLHFEAEGDLV